MSDDLKFPYGIKLESITALIPEKLEKLEIPATIPVAKEYEHILCAKYADLFAYNLGVAGEGEHAYTWSDKPHRLVYDLTHQLAYLRDQVREQVEWQPILTAPLDGTLVELGEFTEHREDVDIGCFAFLELSDWDGTPVYDWTTNRGQIENPTHWRSYNKPAIIL